MTAPIALFVYNRPGHTAKTLESLRRNPESAQSDLIVFCDGLRTGADRDAVEATRRVVRHEAAGFASVRIIERGTNYGLATSITSGVAEVLADYSRIVVLEDDMITSPRFLQYMNEGLERFADEPRVGSVHGYMYPIEALPEFFFVRGGDCWGWGTWRDRWSLYEPDGRVLLRRLKQRGLLREFDRTGGSGLVRLLVEQIRGKNSSWFVRWHAALFLAEKLTLQPGRSFVRNIGMDSSGTHSIGTDLFEVEPRTDYSGLPPLPVQEDRGATERIARYYDRFQRRPWPQRALRYIAAQIRLRIALSE
jgi:Glycosyl transferase family 2